ncbi:MAG: NMD3-related protein [Methanothrix sp.]|nr:NMD3-related protein [Methanothrix sp.]MDD4446878.1 NMD3-related protein [Methanothrix sp.]
MQAICHRCGQPTVEGLCPQCTLEMTKLVSCSDLVEVVICSVCGSRQIKGRWQLPDNSSVEEMAHQAALDALSLHKELAEPHIELDLRKVGATRYLANINIDGSFRGQSVSEQCEIPIRIKLMACDRCSRMAGKYFQSTVQLRGNAVRSMTKREIEECKKTAQDMADSGYHGGDHLSFIQEMKEVKGGLDIILGSTQLGRRMARAFVERFGGKLLETAKLVGKKDSRDVFRSTLLVRFPRLKRGDIVSFRGSLFSVAGFDGKMTLITSLREGRRSSMSEENSETVEILGNKSDAKAAMVISGDENVLEIMDPETYRAAFAARPRDLQVGPGEEVKVVRTADGFIVI